MSEQVRNIKVASTLKGYFKFVSVGDILGLSRYLSDDCTV